MMSATTRDPEAPRPTGGRPYLWLIAGFAVMILTANATMVTIALSSWRGLDTDEPYIQGLNYNQELEERAAQAALGWQLGVTAEQTGPRTLSLAVVPVDGEGRLLSGAAVDGMLVRPTQEGADVPVRLDPAGGRYAGELVVPMPGIWDLKLTVAHQGERLRHEERVYLRP
jgi:nitrogen fixation protein FixH